MQGDSYSLIDYILTNSADDSISAGTIVIDLSDHLSQLGAANQQFSFR